MSDVNWNNVVSAVATEEGLLVTERGADGQVGESAIQKLLKAIPVTQSKAFLVTQSKAFLVTQSKAFLVTISIQLTGYKLSPKTRTSRTRSTTS